MTGQVRAVGALMVACVLSAVLAFAPWTADVFNLTKLTLVGVLLVIAVAIGFLHGTWSLAPPPRALAVPLVALVCATALSTALAQRPALSLIGTYGRFGGLASALVWAGLAVIAASVVRSDRRWALNFARAIASAAAIVAVYALLQRAGIDAFDFRDSTGATPDYPGSTVGNSLFAGSVMGIAAPLLLSELLRGDRPTRRVAAVGLVLITAGLWATSSRSGVVGAAVGCAMVLAATRRPSRRQLAILAVGAAIGGVLVLATPLRDHEAFRTESVRLRAREWRIATASVLDHPLVGTGPDTFGFHYPRYRLAAEARVEGFRITDRAHNIVLDYGVTTGIFGVIAFGAVAIAGLRRTGDDDDGRAAAAGFAAYLAAAQFSFDVPATAAVGFVLLGSAAGIRSPRLLATSAPSRFTSHPRKRANFLDRNPVGTWIILGAVVPGVIWLAVQPWRADTHAGASGRRPTTADGFAAAAVDLEAASRINGREAAYLIAAAQVALSRTFELGEKLALVTANRHLTRALTLQPESVVTIVLAAEVAERYASAYDPAARANAIRLWERGVALDPNNWRTHERLGRALTSFGQDAARGERELRRARVLRSAR